MSRREPTRCRRPSTVTIPTGVSPHVRLIFEELRRQGITYEETEEGSGVLKTTLKAWRHKNRPSLDSIEAVFGFLGWDFVPIPRSDRLPPDVVRALKPIADRLDLTMPGAIQAIVAIVSDIHVDVKTAKPPRQKSPPPPPKRRRGDAHPDQVALFGEATTLH